MINASAANVDADLPYCFQIADTNENCGEHLF